MPNVPKPMIVTMMKTSKMLACSAIALTLSACGANDEAHKCDNRTPGTNDPAWGQCSPVQVDYSMNASDAVQQRIASQVRKDDGIAVNMMNGSGDKPLGPAITIVSKPGDPGGVFIVSKDGWLSQDSAEKMVVDAEKAEPDHVRRVMLLIHMIHDFQSEHPRAVVPPSSVTVTPVAPAPRKSGFSWWKWALAWMPIWGAALFGGYLAAKARVVRRLGKAAPKLWSALTHLLTLPVRLIVGPIRRRRERRKELAQRCVEEAKLVESGDSRGIYGIYTPTTIVEYAKGGDPIDHV